METGSYIFDWYCFLLQTPGQWKASQDLSHVSLRTWIWAGFASSFDRAHLYSALRKIISVE